MNRISKIIFSVLVGGICILVIGLQATAGAGNSASGEKSTFIGVKKCKKCHFKQYKTWRDTKHAKAFECLKGEQQKEAECVRCHTTGYGKGGFTSVEESGHLLNVQCEQCHGAGAGHYALMSQLKKDKVKKTDYPKEKKIIRKPRGCSDCHNPHKKHAPVEKK